MTDPIARHHQEVRKRIKKGEPGWAQSVVGNTLVSLDATKKTHRVTHGGLMRGHLEIVEEMMLDVARDEGGAVASDQAFSRDWAEFLIKDKRRWRSDYTKIHKQANDLETLLNERPALFY